MWEGGGGRVWRYRMTRYNTNMLIVYTYMGITPILETIHIYTRQVPSNPSPTIIPILRISYMKFSIHNDSY